MISMSSLEAKLKKYQNSGYTMYAAFSAASNVTGILTDTVAVAEVLHRYGALSFWDYASAAPYVEINMNPTEKGHKDAIFLSPHKFVGGPGTPGVLIAKKHVFKNPIPGGCGGGTVLFVTRDTHLYLKDIETREEGGTPALIESIRSGMAFQLKQSVGPKLIAERDNELCLKVFDIWSKNPCLTILGSVKARRLPIFSFIVYHQVSGKLLHHNFVSTLLNDLYGIQTRGGCACAGPYAMDLLGVSESLAEKFAWFIQEHDGEQVDIMCQEPLEIMKPGFARINLPYFMDDETVHYVLEAVDMVATHGWKLLPQYCFDSHTGAWRHRTHTNKSPFSLHDVTYDDDGMHVTHDAPFFNKLSMYTLEDIALAASKTFGEAVQVNQEISTLEDEIIRFSDDKDKLVWFLQPQEAQIFLATNTLKFKPFKRTSLPFKPRRLSRNYSGSEMKRRVFQGSISVTIQEDDETKVNGKNHTEKYHTVKPDISPTNEDDSQTNTAQPKKEAKLKRRGFRRKKHSVVSSGESTDAESTAVNHEPHEETDNTKKDCVIQ